MTKPLVSKEERVTDNCLKKGFSIKDIQRRMPHLVQIGPERASQPTSLIATEVKLYIRIMWTYESVKCIVSMLDAPVILPQAKILILLR